MIFKLTLGDWECNGYYANKDYFFESNYSAERITEAYKASCRKYGVQFNSAKHDYTGLGRENHDRVDGLHVNVNHEELPVFEYAGMPPSEAAKKI